MGRCFDPKNPSFCYYGKRGITVCSDWLDYHSFCRDMGIPPAQMSLDRIDNNRGYSKENCRWATAADQNRNKRGLRWIILNGETKLCQDWCREFGVSRSVVQRRLESEWPPLKAFRFPVIRRTEKNWNAKLTIASQEYEKLWPDQ